MTRLTIEAFFIEFEYRKCSQLSVFSAAIIIAIFDCYLDKKKSRKPTAENAVALYVCNARSRLNKMRFKSRSTSSHKHLFTMFHSQSRAVCSTNTSSKNMAVLRTNSVDSRRRCCLSFWSACAFFVCASPLVADDALQSVRCRSIGSKTRGARSRHTRARACRHSPSNTRASQRVLSSRKTARVALARAGKVGACRLRALFGGKNSRQYCIVRRLYS